MSFNPNNPLFFMTASTTPASASTASASMISAAHGEETLPELEEFWSPDPVLGWRVYSIRVHDSDGGLILGGQRMVWLSKTMIAVCDRSLIDDHMRHDRPSPGDYCACGIYATKQPTDLIGKTTYITDGQLQYVIGAHALWGKVVEHDLGYRAEKAQMLALWIVETKDLDLILTEGSRERLAEIERAKLAYGESAHFPLVPAASEPEPILSAVTLMGRPYAQPIDFDARYGVPVSVIHEDEIAELDGLEREITWNHLEVGG